jgi:hypothetical protein
MTLSALLMADQLASDSVRFAAVVRHGPHYVSMPVTGSIASAYGAFSRNDIRNTE